MSGTSFTVGTQAELNAAIESVDTATLAGTYTISLSGDIDLSHAGVPLGEPDGLYVMSLGDGVDVVIDGNGYTINGEGTSSGLAVTTGHVAVSDLTIEDALARGAPGAGGGGGGGAGLGGGLFVGPDAVVGISDVTFANDSARGGPGGGDNDTSAGHSSLVFAPLGNGGTAGTPGGAGEGDGAPGGTGGDGTAGGYGIAGGDGGEGGRGGQPGTTDYGESGGDGGNGGKGAMGGVGGDGGAGGGGGSGGDGIAGFAPGSNAGDAGNGGDGGDGGDAEYGGGGGAGGYGGDAGRGAEGGSRSQASPAGESTDGGNGGNGGKGGDGAFGGGGGPGGVGGFGGMGGTGANGAESGNGGAGGNGGNGGNGDFGGGGGGGGPGGNGGRAGAGLSMAPGSVGAGGSAGMAGLGGFGGGKGADGEAGYAGPTAESTQVPPEAFGGAGGGGLGAGGAIFVADGGQLTVDGGLVSGGTVTGGASGGPNAGAGSAYGAGIFIQGNDTISLATPDASLLTIGNVIADEKGSGGTGSGALAIGAGGTINLAATNTFTGGVTITGGTLELSAVGAAGSGNIVFDAAGDPTLAFDAAFAPANTITGLGAGDVIAVSDKTLSDAIYSGTAAHGTLDVTFSDGGSVQLAIAGDYSQANFAVVDNQVAVSCFVAGTHIMTETGEKPVETIVAGDRVVTIVDGAWEMAPVIWVGRRKLEPARHPQPEQVLPVRICRDAFGAGLPDRDLFLSPDHAIYAEAVLIPVKYLINGTTIVQIRRTTVTYVHLELPDHAVVLAEGLPCESYLDTGDRAGFAGGALTALHPAWGCEGLDIALLMDAVSYAPLRVDGVEVDRLRAQLAEQAASLSTHQHSR